MYRRRKSSALPSVIFILSFVAIVVYGMWLGYKHYFSFDARAILDNSVLREKTFEKQAVEVVSPIHKIKAYLLEDKSNPIISLSFMFKNAGLSADAASEYGISNIVSELLVDGAGELDSQSMKEKMENLAIGISFDADRDNFSGSLVTTTQNQAEAYHLLKSILSSPHFDEKDLNRLKAQIQNAFLRQKEHPSGILALDFAEFLYGKHPYGRNPLGDLKAIKKLKPDDLRRYVKERFTADNLIVGVAGDINAEKLGLVLDEVFGALPSKGRLPFVRNAKVDFDGRSKNIDQKTGQNISTFAVKGVARNEADFYPLYVANHIFGGSGLSSRISKAAREEEGLTYSIYTYLSLADKSPLLMGGFSSTAENYSKVWDILNREWSKFATDGASQKEVDDAKNYLISSYNLRFASIGNLSEILMYMQKENLGLDFLQKRNEYIKKVTKDDVDAAAKKYFAKDSMVTVNIGKF